MAVRMKRIWIFLLACVFIFMDAAAAFFFLDKEQKSVPAAFSLDRSNQFRPRPKGLRAEIPVSAGRKVAYLTFDDGPSSLTPELLEVLKENHVNATFFIVGLNAQKYPDTLKQMKDDGDAIGVHSWTHRYSYIYKNTANFQADFHQLNDYIYQQTGVHSKICRFPGGTSNTVCFHYNRNHIMRQIVVLVHKMDFQYYDWNVSSGEASTIPPSKAKIVSNVISQCEGKNTAVILFHDSDHQEYVDAVPDIIAKLRSEGFRFDTLAPGKLSKAALKAVQFLPA